MSQSGDYSLANQSGANFRAELNTILGDVKSTNSGATAPSSPVEGTLWYDSTNNVLKSYNGSSWTTVNTTYSVGDGGLTEKNFTSADNTKLDGIESGATADQTKTDIEGLGIAASSITGALPAIDGSALTNLPVAAAASGAAEFTADGTWNWVDAGSPSKVFVTVVGAGGGGSGGSGNTAIVGGPNRGGGGGGWNQGVVSVTGNVSVTVGAGGIGGYTNTSIYDGTAGGASTFGTISAGGGGGGIYSGSVGAGGSGLVAGEPGEVPDGSSYGPGGKSFIGKAGYYNGQDGSLIGGGGAGGRYQGVGGDGADGIVFIVW